jgi:hypothetical protein
VLPRAPLRDTPPACRDFERGLHRRRICEVLIDDARGQI